MSQGLDDLLERCKQGDRQSMATLLSRYWQHAQDQAAAVLGDEQLAEDAAQETMVIVFQRLDKLRSPAAFAGWLRQIARSCAYRIVRSGGVSHRELVSEPAVTDQAPAALQRRELERLVRHVVSRLPRPSREPVELYYLDELAQEEIAHKLDIPAGTLKRRLYDARKVLRDMLLGYITDGRLPQGLKPDDDSMIL